MHWSRWGDPAQAGPLAPAAQELVDAFLGTRATPAVDPEKVRLSAPLAEELLAELAELVGPEQVLTDDGVRLHRTRGKSTLDLLRIRTGDGTDSPDAVVRPGTHDEVLALLAWAERRQVAVVPFGGGTSVVGGLVADRDRYRGVISLDLVRFDKLLAVDPVSMTAVLEPGLRGPDAERLLAEHGLTLGHFPQSFEYATIGGFAATRSSGQSSAGYGRFDSLVVAVRVATPRGSWEPGNSPANAAGPDLRQLALGSEGAFGVITAVTVRVRQLPETRRYLGWRFASFAAGAQAMRELAQAQLLPTVIRLSDENETAINLARPSEVGGESAGGCLMIVGFEGTPAAVAAKEAAVTPLLAAAGGAPQGEEAGTAWAAGRFHGPYLRDSLLDVGVLVETLETVTFWSNLDRLYADVRAALSEALGAQSMVLCHISHVYETGASLYFTVAAPQEEDALAQWQRAKSAASAAMIAAGASITHHHAVGRDHQPWFIEEIGPIGVEILRSVKASLDPAGILNPGVLIP